MARTSKSRGAAAFKMRSGNSSTFKMMGSSPMRVDPTDPKDEVTTTSDKDELVEYTYPAHSTEARGGGYKSGESRDVLISKGTQRLIDANAPKDVIEKSKARDIDLFKQAGGKSREL